MWGRDILVAPVTEKGATSRNVYLPKGGWFDFWTGARIEGGRETNRAVDLATMPLYIRAGAIIPFGPIKQYTEEKVDGPLTIKIYPGANGEFTLYEDDGKTFDFRRGQWMGIRMGWDDASKRLSLSLAKGSRMLPPYQRDSEVQLITNGQTRRVNFTGRPIRVQF